MFAAITVGDVMTVFFVLLVIAFAAPQDSSEVLRLDILRILLSLRGQQ